jgi:hypothetical protein
MPWLIIDRKNASIDREFDRAALLTPRPFDRRIAAQSGVLDVHPKRALTATQVNEEAREATPDGVDLEGLSAFVNWETRRSGTTKGQRK